VDYPIGTGSPPTSGVSTQVTVPTTVGNFYTLNPVIEGSSNYNRLGRRIRMKSIQIVINMESAVQTLTPSAPATVFAPRMRIALVYDRQPSGGAVPAFNDVWQQRDQFGLSSDYEWSPNNVDNQSRFIILRDCKINFATNNALETNQISLSINNAFIEGTQCKLFKKLKGLETNFRSNTVGNTGNTIADIQSGALYLVFRSNMIPADATIACTWTSRLRFYDAL